MHKAAIATAVALLAAAGITTAAAWQPATTPDQQGQSPGQPARQPGRPAGDQPGAPAQRRGGPDMAAMLISGLENTPGCLGVDAGQFRSGKLAIMAWFENKQAVLNWYNSPAHQRMAASLTGGEKPGEPLAHITDEETPILVIASLTPNGQDGGGGSGGGPFSQLAIELYAPLPGGAYIGGRMAPEAFEIPHMRSMTTPPETPTTNPATPAEQDAETAPQ